MNVAELREILSAVHPDLDVTMSVSGPEGTLQGFEVEVKLRACGCGDPFLEIVASDIGAVLPLVPVEAFPTVRTER